MHPSLLKEKKAFDPVRFVEGFIAKMLRYRAVLAQRLGGRCFLELSGPGGGTWIIDLDEVTVRTAEAEAEADLRLRVTANKLEALINQKYDLRQARKSGDVSVSGDLDMLSKLGFLLRPAS